MAPVTAQLQTCQSDDRVIQGLLRLLDLSNTRDNKNSQNGCSSVENDLSTTLPPLDRRHTSSAAAFGADLPLHGARDGTILSLRTSKRLQQGSRFVFAFFVFFSGLFFFGGGAQFDPYAKTCNSYATTEAVFVVFSG